MEQVKKDRLTTKELEILTSSTIHPFKLRNPFLFMCYTGLRFSDAVQLKYGDIKKIDDGYQISIRQKKTNKLVSIPLVKNALSQIGNPDKEDLNELVFKNVKSSIYLNYLLKNWVLENKIFKSITWHSARHTFGQRLHDNGVDIYTIAELMGDTIDTVVKNYVKVSDKSKFNAVKKL